MSKNIQKLQKALQSNVIEIKAVTWSKDSHGLFDYESKNCINNKFKFKAGNYSIMRSKQNSEIIAVPTEEARQQELEGEYSLLTTIFSKKENDELNYYVGTTPKIECIKQPNEARTQQSLSLTDQVGKDDTYLIVRSLKNTDGTNKGHALEIQQKIKLGRVEYSVIEMKVDEKKELSKTSRFSFLNSDSKFQDMDVEIEPDASCKVCMDISSPDNFLFSPCKCSGSCKYIHIQCLKKWMLSKVKKEVTGGTAYYHFDKFECQICKYALPKFIVKNGIQHQLLSVDRPQGNYLILQQVGQNKNDIIVIRNIPEDGLKLGRGHNCQIRINDISVSRQHAVIFLKDGKFMIFDKNSKFGTLIRLAKNLQIDNTKRAFQIGRTVLTFMMKKQRVDPKQIKSFVTECIEEEKPQMRITDDL